MSTLVYRLTRCPLPIPRLLLFAAESFFAPTWLRMCHAVVAGDWAAARAEQAWKLGAAAIFSSFSSDVERTVYRHTLGVDLGPPRPPDVAASESEYASLIAQLEAYGFFNQSVPGPCAL
jgi:dihydrodipicolinate synthase/N-acetylneuraminate lyase